MRRLVLVLCVLVFGLTLTLASASAVSAPEGWRVIGRATDAGTQVAVAVAAKRRTTKLAVRVRVTGAGTTAELHTVVTCSKAGYWGIGVFSRRDKFTVAVPAFRVLRLPIAYPENCGVTVIGMSDSVLRVVGNTVVHRGYHCREFLPVAQCRGTAPASESDRDVRPTRHGVGLGTKFGVQSGALPLG